MKIPFILIATTAQANTLIAALKSRAIPILLSDGTHVYPRIWFYAQVRGVAMPSAAKTVETFRKSGAKPEYFAPTNSIGHFVTAVRAYRAADAAARPST